VRRRARILLGAAVGRSNREIGRTLSLDPATVAFWRRRFVNHRLEGGLLDAPRPRRRREHSDLLAERILRATDQVAPPNGTRWTTRALARHLGVNHMQVHRAWKSQSLLPRSLAVGDRGTSTPLSRPRVDLLGVVLQPPRRAVIFGREVAAEGSPTEAVPPGGAPRAAVSGGYLLNSGDNDSEEFVAILRRMETWVARDVGAVGEWHDLLILLRELDDRVPATTQVHVILQNGDDAEARRLSTWSRRHARFHLHRIPPDRDWLEEAQALLAEWSAGEGAAPAFGGVTSFASAAARCAAGTSLGEHGLVWSNPATVPEPGDRRTTVGTDPAPVNARRGDG
jgi:homeodomain-containing protein